MGASNQLDRSAHGTVIDVSVPSALTTREPVAVQAALQCWCSAGEWSLCFRTPKFGLLRCSACGCYQIDPPPLRGEEESAGFYTDYYAKANTSPIQPKSRSMTKSAWFWRVAEKVPSLAEVRDTVVDIGSGDGHTCAELRAAGWPSVAGIEISRTRMAHAQRLYPEIKFYSCSLAETGIAQESLDLMVMDSVIEHLPNPVEMVRDLRRFLKPGGTIVFLTPNMDSGHFRFLGRRWTGMLAPHAHIFLFTAAALSRALTNAGFVVSKTGSLHMPAYRPAEFIGRLASGDVKGAAWRAHQEIGGWYGRMIGAGPMLYAVANRT